MNIWEILALIVYALFDFIFLEILVFIVFKVNSKGAVKLGSHKGEFKASEYFVFGIILFSLIYFFISNLFQDTFLLRFSLLTWVLIPIILSLLSVSVFFLSKVILGRKWDFRLVWSSLTIMIMCIIVFGMGIYLKLT